LFSVSRFSSRSSESHCLAVKTQPKQAMVVMAVMVAADCLAVATVVADCLVVAMVVADYLAVAADYLAVAMVVSACLVVVVVIRPTMAMTATVEMKTPPMKAKPFPTPPPMRP